MSKKKRKVRTEFRKNRSQKTRGTNWTREFDEHGFQEKDPLQGERVSGKGDLTRHRTVLGEGNHYGRRTPPRHPPRNRRKRVPSGASGQRSRTELPGSRRGGRLGLHLCRAAASEDPHHRPTTRRCGRRPGAVSQRCKQRPGRGDHRTNRAPARESLPRQPGPAACPGHERGPGADHLQRRRTPHEAQPHRSAAHRCRKGDG